MAFIHIHTNMENHTNLSVPIDSYTKTHHHHHKAHTNIHKDIPDVQRWLDKENCKKIKIKAIEHAVRGLVPRTGLIVDAVVLLSSLQFILQKKAKLSLT